MYDIVINNFEEMQKELLAENQALKQSLFEVYMEGRTVLKQYASDEYLTSSLNNPQVRNYRCLVSF
jgi:ABC-type Zn uptake system ZnuABC Zn-binding protein ZnuA